MKLRTVSFLSIARIRLQVAGILLLFLFGQSVDAIKVNILRASANKAALAAAAAASSGSATVPDGSCTRGSCPPGPSARGHIRTEPPPPVPGPQIRQETRYPSVANKPSESPKLPGEPEKLHFISTSISKDEIGFEAIHVLHKQLDDDANGNIDVSESDEFLRDELKYENGYERQKTFHGNDKHISVDELWNSWKLSEVHNWTVVQTIQWLTDSVELPQYTQVFQEQHVNGTRLPSMAVPNMHYLTQTLGIKDPRHKQKIALKAMDVVLFGPPKHSNFIKDVLLVSLLVIATVGCWFAFVQHKRSQTHMKKMMRDMESLQHAEEALESLQYELDKARQENLQHKIREREDGTHYLRAGGRESSQPRSYGGGASGSSGGSSPDEEELTRRQEVEEELRRTKEQLARMEYALKSRAWAPPAALQHWLQMTYELEQRHYNSKKAAAEMQLASAKEGCEKIRKRRSSFLGTFRIAHGSVIDDVDSRILQARAALSDVTKDLQERLHRWRQIELLCGFPIVMNAGLLQLEVILRGTSVANGRALGLGSARGNMSRSCSEGTLLEDDASSTTSATPFGNPSAGSVISMPSQGFNNAAHLPSIVVPENIARSFERGSLRVGSTGSLGSESKSLLVTGSHHLHQLEEEDDDCQTDDELDNGELDEGLDDALKMASNGRSSSAPPEDVKRPLFTLGSDSMGDSSANDILNEKRNRMLKSSQSQDQPNQPAPIQPQHHSPYYQQSSSSSTSSTASPSICQENTTPTAIAAAAATSVSVIQTELVVVDQPPPLLPPLVQGRMSGVALSGAVGATVGVPVGFSGAPAAQVSGRRKKSSNLISTFRSSLSTNPPPTLEEEANSTDSASVDDSDNTKKEKKKVSILSRLKKKSKSP